MAKTLETLFHYLDGLQSGAALAELLAHVEALAIDGDDVAKFIRFSDRQYMRNLVRAGPWYHVWVLCWKNGQRSPIHDHAGSCCAVRVLRGTPTVTSFAFAPNGHVKATGSEDFPPGSVLGNQDADVHQVSNLQAGDADVVTL